MELTRLLSYKLPLLRGEDVRAVQVALLAIPGLPAFGSADGVFGAMTRDAVKAFQRINNSKAGAKLLDEDGVVGPNTWKVLFQTATDAGAKARPVAVAQSGEPLPLSQAQVKKVKAWMEENFGPRIAARVAATNLDTTPAFDAATVYAIACKETAPKWLKWTSSHKADEILARCVFDASGDWPGTSRSAFPANTAAFRARYGAEATAMLIEEANKARAMQGWGPKAIVYKGYGIFQYDLQHIDRDPDFFLKKQWASFDACLDKLIAELVAKRAASRTNNLRETIRRYNGAGPRAETYADHVMAMRAFLL